MTAYQLEDPLDEAELAADVEFHPLQHGLVATYIVGFEAKRVALARITARQAERERQAKAAAKRSKRDALGRSNARPGRRGGAA